MSATTGLHPAIAETQRLYLEKPPSLVDLLQVALDRLYCGESAQLKLTLKPSRRTCDVGPFRELRARMYCELVRRGGDSFDLPLEIRNLNAPSQWALLCFENVRPPNLMFHNLGLEAHPTDISDHLQNRWEFFQEIREQLKGKRGVPGGRNHMALLAYIDQGLWAVPEKDLQMGRELVNRHFRLDA